MFKVLDKHCTGLVLVVLELKARGASPEVLLDELGSVAKTTELSGANDRLGGGGPSKELEVLARVEIVLVPPRIIALELGVDLKL